MCNHIDYPCCGCGPEIEYGVPECGCCRMPMDECYCHEMEDDYPDDYDDSMDGDHESALASAGFGADEDYGMYADDIGMYDFGPGNDDYGDMY